MKKIILASNSFRRRELLSKLNIKFDVKVANIDEDFDKSIDVLESVKNISYLKAKKVFDENKDAIVIGSDTIVYFNNEIIGKPERELLKKYNTDDFYKLIRENENVLKEAEDIAFNMLKSFSNRTHEVMTGIAIISENRVFKDVSITKVTFSNLTDDDILEYVKTNEPFGKAGGYAVQENAGKFIERIDGDFWTIVGFPLNIVFNELKNIDLY